MDIKKMEADQRPRERLVKLGVESLSDYELLAIMLGCGSKEKSVLDLAYDLVSQYGLNRLMRMDFCELKQIKGIKLAKASKLMACFELARRCVKEKEQKNSLNTAKDVFRYIESEFYFLDKERLMVLYVDSKCRVIEKIFIDGFEVSQIEIPIRQIVSVGISCNAVGIFLIHNHPNGDIQPSTADIRSTRYIQRILNEIHISVLDHLIVYQKLFYSFDENHLLNR